ncbi:MAG TPA: M56 family metallopeptidase [Beutenbergiaceae bacterium]|nr:M56 family metallopeptidase [Beutenbergiaceae bacterium]
MGVTAVTLLLSSALLLAALSGPVLLRRSAPALASIPRAAALTLTLSALLWIAALVALGPVVAWISTGPSWLPQQAAEVCGRCLSASSPFAQGAVSLGIPAIVPLALPALGLAAALIGLIGEVVRLKHSHAALARTLQGSSTQDVLHGHWVHITPDARPVAFSFPHRNGGIFVSRGTLAALTPKELAAVLQHEHAHLRQRHHLYLTILNGTTRYFRWIPFIRAVRAAVPHYLEIAADRAARNVSGTAALAGALLHLGQPALPETAAHLPEHAVLHAAGSERIRHLTGQPRPRASTAMAAGVGAYAFMLAAAIAAVHWPYLLAILTGC